MTIQQQLLQQFQDTDTQYDQLMQACTNTPPEEEIMSKVHELNKLGDKLIHLTIMATEYLTPEELTQFQEHITFEMFVHWRTCHMRDRQGRKAYKEKYIRQIRKEKAAKKREVKN